MRTLLVALALLHALASVRAARKQLFQLGDNVNDGTSSLATDAPVTRALADNPRMKARVDALYELFDIAIGVMDNRLVTKDRLSCNLPNREPWLRQAKSNSMVRQLGITSDDCHSRLDVTSAIESDTLPDGFVLRSKAIMSDATDALFQVAITIPQIPDASVAALNWTNGPHPLTGWQINEDDQTCSVENAFAYRKDGKLFLRSRITNNPVNAFLPQFQRQFIDEYIPRDLSSFPIQLLHRRHTDLETLELSTTILSRFAGRANFATFGSMTPRTNPALSEALRLNELAVDQANEALTVSNVAILALPMVMSLIPVAFVADLNTLATLWYIIFTDVFSVLPFMIKGVELISSASSAHSEMAVFYAGNATLGTLEMWSAECKGESSFKVVGIIFVCIAIFALLFGIFLEAVASRAMRRRRLAKGAGTGGPFGTAAFDHTKFAPLGRIDEGVAEWERRYSEAEARLTEEEMLAPADRRTSKEMLEDMELELEEEDGRGRWWEFRRRRKRRELQEMVREYEVELGLRQRNIARVTSESAVDDDDIVGAPRSEK